MILAFVVETWWCWLLWQEQSDIAICSKYVADAAEYTYHSWNPSDLSHNDLTV